MIVRPGPRQRHVEKEGLAEAVAARQQVRPRCELRFQILGRTHVVEMELLEHLASR
jgi:hypothetical protein